MGKYRLFSVLKYNNNLIMHNPYYFLSNDWHLLFKHTKNGEFNQNKTNTDLGCFRCVFTNNKHMK